MIARLVSLGLLVAVVWIHGQTVPFGQNTVVTHVEVPNSMCAGQPDGEVYTNDCTLNFICIGEAVMENSGLQCEDNHIFVNRTGVLECTEAAAATQLERCPEEDEN